MEPVGIQKDCFHSETLYEALSSSFGSVSARCIPTLSCVRDYSTYTLCNDVASVTTKQSTILGYLLSWLYGRTGLEPIATASAVTQPTISDDLYQIQVCNHGNE